MTITVGKWLWSTWWWLSFCDPARPEGEQFLGVAIVQGVEMATAVTMAHVMGVNPGGEVLGHPISEALTVPDEYQNRLLTREEAAELDAIFGRQKAAVS